MKATIVISCEHAGNTVPEKYKHLFVGAEEILASHRGWDLGARQIASALADRLNVPFFFCETSRLIIEPNRSLHHHQLYSEFTTSLSEIEKQELVEQIYEPYRRSVEDAIRQTQKPVIHLSIHSFTPVMNGVTRDVDIGLLFDPTRDAEANLCSTLQKQLSAKLSPWRIKYNEPYLGIDDGFTTYLRTKFSDQEYAGIEIEVNQKFTGTSDEFKIANALVEVVGSI